MVVLLSFLQHNSIMGSTATRHEKVFSFPDEGRLHRMAPHNGLSTLKERALVGHFLYNIRSSEMDSVAIGGAWATSMNEMRKAYGEHDSKFLQKADSIFERTIRALILNQDGSNEKDVKRILDAKGAWELQGKEIDSFVAGLLRTESPRHTNL